MPDLNLRNLPVELVADLKQRARIEGQTLRDYCSNLLRQPSTPPVIYPLPSKAAELVIAAAELIRQHSATPALFLREAMRKSSTTAEEEVSAYQPSHRETRGCGECGAIVGHQKGCGRAK